MTFERAQLGKGVYSRSDISWILEIPRSRAGYLLREYTSKRFRELSNFNYDFGDKNVKLVNFQGLIELKIFHIWRTQGVPVKNIMNAHQYLSNKYKTKYPLALNNLAIAGKDVIEDLKGKGYLKADGSNQSYLGLIRPFIRKIEYDDGFAIKLYPLGRKGQIVVDPSCQSGQPIIEGTRIAVSNIACQHNAGDSIKLLSKLYQLPRNKIKAAIDYYNSAAA